MYILSEEYHGERRNVCSWPEMPSEKELYAQIRTFADSLGYKPHYTRSWKDENNNIWYDFGSWSTFLVLSEAPDAPRS